MPEARAYTLFPLDEELELQAGKLTPKGRERLIRLSGWMPFRQATELFSKFTGIRNVSINRNASARSGKRAGGRGGHGWRGVAANLHRLSLSARGAHSGLSPCRRTY